MQFEIIRNPNAQSEEARTALMADPGFGRVFTDHMVTIRWSAEKGWHEPQVRARAPFQLDPAAAVLHYAQEIFEGLKAYRGADGGITMFRPERNAQRFNASARRMAMAELPEDVFVQACEELIRIEEENEVEIVIVAKSDVCLEHMTFRCEDANGKEQSPS